LADKLLFGS